MEKKTTYKDAGVDIDAGNRLVSALGDIVKPTLRPEVMSSIGGFGSVVSLAETPYANPVLVSSTDGVGTKLKIAFEANKHDTVGIDLVAMCVNDVIVQGAEPLFFLDYFATGSLEEGVARQVITGIAEGCRQANCSLVGGETAEMPGMYGKGEYDLAGFSVGIADRDKLIDGSTIARGDAVVGLASSGIHSNGYSLVRKVLFEDAGLAIDHVFDELGVPLWEELLKPTKIYVRTLLNIKRDFTVKGVAHITGGGLPENLPRVLPQGLMAELKRNSWEQQPIFSIIQRLGGVPEEDLLRTFNCGIGLVLIVPGEEAEEVIARLTALGEKASLIGTIKPRVEGQEAVEIS
ncbi:MAG: phosphoribosylformylglycinamidine cyclo-ligase [Deltaproteobacteria bacterium]|nr:MAG: phosphoribosylformylglycinamidine cyclo-ligase [Deltaproteobacteria bacterium]